MNRTPPGWVPDPSLDAKSVSAMTADEAKEYLKLLLEIVKLDLPSLRWLRRAAWSREKGSQETTPTDESHSSAAAASRLNANNDVLNVLRRVLQRGPVTFELSPKQSSGQTRRRPRKSPRR